MKRILQTSRILPGLLGFLLALSLANGLPTARAAAACCVKTVPQPFVCITIDDGYGSDSVRRDLQTLRDNHVNATFFIIGSQLLRKELQPLWRQAVAEGNEICYHTMRHTSIAKMNERQLNADITAWENAAHRVLGADYAIPRLVRFPGGGSSNNPRIARLFASRGYTIVYWSADTLTGAIRKHRNIDRYVKGKVRPGTILLTHFNAADSTAMARYLPWLKAHYSIAKLSDAYAPPPKPAADPTPTESPTAIPETPQVSFTTEASAPAVTETTIPLTEPSPNSSAVSSS